MAIIKVFINTSNIFIITDGWFATTLRTDEYSMGYGIDSKIVQSEQH